MISIKNIISVVVTAALTILITACGSNGVKSDDGFIDDINNIPTAIITAPNSVFYGDMTIATGNLSEDLDNENLTYQWNLIPPTGSQSVLEFNNEVQTSFTPDIMGQYKLQLVVNDGYDNSEIKEVIVMANDYAYSVVATGRYWADMNGSSVQDIEISKDGKKLFASLNWWQWGVLDGAAQMGVAEIDLDNNTTYIHDNSLETKSIKLSEDEKYIYAAHGSEDNMSIIDLTTKEYVFSTYVAQFTNEMYIEPDQRTMWIGGDPTANNTSGPGPVLYKFDLLDRVVLDSYVDVQGWGRKMIPSKKDPNKLYFIVSNYNFLYFDKTDGSYVEMQLPKNASDRPVGSELEITNDEKFAYIGTAGLQQGIVVMDLVDQNFTKFIFDINETDTLLGARQLDITQDDKLLFVADKSHSNQLYYVNRDNNDSIEHADSIVPYNCKMPGAVEISKDNTKVYQGCTTGAVIEYSLTKIPK